MARETTLIVHFGDVERTPQLSEALARRCSHLAEEFNETDCFEISLCPDKTDVSAHAKVTGKSTRISAHANAPHEMQAADAALNRLERELRNRHDKRIFSPRREARRTKAARRTEPR
jgi:ribosome-associated translation inhibitor RaiA